ncbi:hypothetical protein LX32DRAFT_5023 [Colletotrichum zoysiae]|uniref:Uncharacterized protein n=1 Tax=Colletotrichum zoysiae TaxID=1216348 RepID=A0AAD9HS52_9PEZI|nr:hypothetical protein LX32DRAFT_5023 [Colletotrichum zoysiae]
MMPYKLREARPMQANLLLLCTLRKASDAGCSRQLGHPYRGERGFALHYTCRIPKPTTPSSSDLQWPIKPCSSPCLSAARKKHEPTAPRCWPQTSTICWIFAAGNLAIVARSLQHACRPIWSPDRMDGAVDS